MKNFLQFRSRRFGFDGWALKHRNGTVPWTRSVCTTRAEARAIKALQLPEMQRDLEVVKVRVHLEVVK